MLINIKKEYAYAIIGLLILGIGVFVVHALTPGIAPNPGHTIDMVAPPAGCSDRQVLQFVDEASGWGCVDDASCDISDTCSQVCIGSDCQSGWPSSGLSGYEIKTASKRSASHFTVDVYCSAGKKVLGGGCNQQAGWNRALVDNNPIGTTGWHCRGRDVGTPQTVTLTAYAICAVVD